MSALISFIGWSFLPSMAAGSILHLWYRIVTRTGDEIPRRGTPHYDKHYKRVRVMMVSLYLLYTIYEAYFAIPRTPNYYNLLSIPITVNEKELRSQFRRLTVQFHPDKIGKEGSGYFVLIKHAYDVLKDPSKRFGYDRFGPDFVSWKYSTTMYEYLVRGITQLGPWYVGSLLFLVILSVLGKLEHGRYWRFYAFFWLLIVEITVITRPPMLSWLPFTTLLPFEQLILARKLVFTSFMAISQLDPMLRNTAHMSAPVTVVAHAQLERLYQLTGRSEDETHRALTEELLPFKDHTISLKCLGENIEAWITEQAIRNTFEARNVMGQSPR